MEIVTGPEAYRHDGSLYRSNSEVLATTGATPAVADLDGDGVPEIIVSANPSLFVLDHTLHTLRSVDLGIDSSIISFPVAIHDVDGDGAPEILASNGVVFTAYRGDLSVLWTAPVDDSSGTTVPFAFDFFGDGRAETIYQDDNNTWFLGDADGRSLYAHARWSSTLGESATVADIDNDGSADVLVTQQASPLLQVLSHPSWMPARRIMNQESYHVTNVNEDGTIPQHETPHWKLNNSFRAQAQTNADGSVCLPRVE
jgi:hypothetical protein